MVTIQTHVHAPFLHYFVVDDIWSPLHTFYCIALILPSIKKFYCPTGECFSSNSKFPKRNHRKREKNKKNTLQLLFFANRVSHSTPLKKNSTSNSDAYIGTTKERLMNQQNSHIKKSSSTSAASAPQAPRILRDAADDTLESALATQESALARFDGLDSTNTSSTKRHGILGVL